MKNDRVIPLTVYPNTFMTLVSLDQICIQWTLFTMIAFVPENFECAGIKKTYFEK